MKKYSNIIIKVIIFIIATMLTTTSSALIYYEGDAWNNGMPLGVKNLKQRVKRIIICLKKFRKR